MIENLLIPVNEASDLVRAVLEYNGRHPGQVSFLDGEGKAVDLQWIQITCDGTPLAVRVAPDSDPAQDALMAMNNQVLYAIMAQNEDQAARNLAQVILNPPKPT